MSKATTYRTVRICEATSVTVVRYGAEIPESATQKEKEEAEKAEEKRDKIEKLFDEVTGGGYLRDDVPFIKDNPPTRNYYVVYHFPDITVKDGSSECNLDNCPGLINKDLCGYCSGSKTCRIMDHSGELLALLEGISHVCVSGKDIITPNFYIQNKDEKIKNNNIASGIGEVCFIESQSAIIRSKKLDFRIAGQVISSKDYWDCIIRGLFFLTGGITLLMLISKTLVECTNGFSKLDDRDRAKRDKEVREIEDTIFTVSHLLNRDRVALSPSAISRGSYARTKFDRFVAVSGVASHLKTVELCFRDLNFSVRAYGDRMRQNEMEKFTKIIVIGTLILGLLTTIIAHGTVILARKEREGITYLNYEVFSLIILFGWLLFINRHSKWVSWFFKKLLNFDSFSA